MLFDRWLMFGDTPNFCGGFLLRIEHLDRLWLYGVLALIGNSFTHEEEICGAVVSVRKENDKIALWLKGTEELVTKEIGALLKQTLELPDGYIIGFQAHSDSIRGNSSFNNINRYEL